MSQVGLDIKTFLEQSGDMQGTYVRGPGGDNAIPAVVTRKFIGETTPKVVRLSHIYRIPPAQLWGSTENINAGQSVIGGCANGMVLKFVLPSGSTRPNKAVV